MKYQTAVNKMKKIVGKRYFSIQYGRTFYTTGRVSQDCQLYAEGTSWISSPTWEQSLKLIEQALKEPDANDNDMPENELQIKEKAHENKV